MLSKDPLGVLLLAVGVSLTGAFGLALHTGVSMREAKAGHYDFSFHGAAVAASTFLADFERGGKIMQARAGGFFNDLFGGGASQPSSGNSASARRWGRGNNDEAGARGDPFEQSYEEQYGRGYVPSADLAGSGGETAFSGGGESGTTQLRTRVRPGAGLRKYAGSGAVSREAMKASPVQPRSSGARPQEGGMSALRHAYASVADNDPGRSAGAQTATSGAPSSRYSGSGSSARPASWGKEGGGGALDGAMDGLRSGAQSSYNSKMQGGASAAVSAASSAGGSAPAASAAKDVSAAGGSAAASVKPAVASADEGSGDNYGSGVNSPVSSPEETDPLKSVVSEKLNGSQLKSVSEDDTSGTPDAALLKAGAVSGDGDAKAALESDPPKYSDLSGKRRMELKREIHVFLKKVENKYGPMTDIYATSCGLTRDICAEHGLTENYLTMSTARKAKLVVGVKYTKARWRLYTVAFTPPPAIK